MYDMTKSPRFITQQPNVIESGSLVLSRPSVGIGRLHDQKDSTAWWEPKENFIVNNIS